MDRPGPMERVGMKVDRWLHQPLKKPASWYAWRVMLVTWLGWALTSSLFELIVHGDWSRLFFYLTWFAIGGLVGAIYAVFEFRRNHAEETEARELRGTGSSTEGR